MVCEEGDAASKVAEKKMALDARSSTRDGAMRTKMKKDGLSLADVGAVEGPGDDAVSTTSALRPSVATTAVDAGDGLIGGADEHGPVETSAPDDAGSTSMDGATTTAAALSNTTNNNDEYESIV